MPITDILLFVPGVFLAGVLMFLAPCTLPIVPGYLAFIAGVPAGEKGMRGRIFRNALAFVIGFSIVFILLGTFAGFLGGILGPWRDWFGRIAGLIIIIFGLSMLGLIKLPMLSGERRPRVPKILALGRWESSLLIGALFALGWSPCIGPILGTVLVLASTSSAAVAGAFLLGVFSFGLAIPFLLTALLIDRATELFNKWSRAVNTFTWLGGLTLIGLGLLMLSGNMGLLITWGYTLFEFINYDRLLKYL